LKVQQESNKRVLQDSLHKAKEEIYILKNKQFDELYSLGSNDELNYDNNLKHNGNSEYTLRDINLKVKDSKTESLIKSLNNKIDYLKLQLETEQSTIDELKNVITMTQEKNSELRYEFQLKLSDKENDYQNKLKEQRSLLEERFEIKMKETYSLRDKVDLLELQITESNQV
jgi:hypothetical protein